MSSVAIDSIQDLSTDSKKRATRIAQIQQYQDHVDKKFPLETVKKTSDVYTAAPQTVTKPVSSLSSSANSVESLCCYQPQLISNSQTQAPKCYKQVESNVSSIILDLLPTFEGLVEAVKMLGVTQSNLQGNLQNTWQLYSAMANAYSDAMKTAHDAQLEQIKEAGKKAGLFSLLAAVVETVFAVVTIATSLTPPNPLALIAGGALLADGISKISKSAQLLEHPETFGPDFLTKYNEGIMGDLGFHGNAPQIIFQIVTTVASLASTFLRKAAEATTMSMLQKAVQTLVSKLDRVFSVFEKVENKAVLLLIKGLRSILNGLLNPIETLLKICPESIKNTLAKGIQFLSREMSNIKGDIRNFIATVLKKALKKLPDVLLKIKEAIVDFMSKAFKHITDAVKGLEPMKHLRDAAKVLEPIVTKIGQFLNHWITRIVNDVVTLIGLCDALSEGGHQAKAMTTTPQDPSTGQMILTSFQNGLIGFLISLPFTVEKSKGNKTDANLEMVLNMALPMLLNSGFMSTNLANGMATQNKMIESVLKRFAELQSSLGLYGYLNTSTGISANIIQTENSEKQMKFQNEAHYAQSIYSANSAQVNTRIDFLNTVSSDVQKMLNDILKSVPDFANILSQIIATNGNTAMR